MLNIVRLRECVKKKIPLKQKKADISRPLFIHPVFGLFSSGSVAGAFFFFGIFCFTTFQLGF